jgi:DUF4097 and DUF4098 domain-containing protein YvlB
MKERSRQKNSSGRHFFSVMVLAVALFINIAAARNSIKYYSRTFKVSPQNAALTLSNPSGSIKVKTWERAEIKANATLAEDSLAITDRQLGDSIEIEVHCSKAGAADFEISVPQSCTLDIKCLNGPIEISAASGRIIAQTTEGEISLSALHSSNITAKSISGSISYNGDLDPNGIYNFDSMENSVDITLPASSAFTLLATAMVGKIELGDFQLSDSVPHEKRVSGKYRGGGASLILSTHRGQIRLHKN